MPQKSTYFYPKLFSGPPLSRALSEPWLELARTVAVDVQAVLADLPTRADREPVVGAGLGGDDTTAIDAAAEAAVVRRLEALHAEGHEFTLVSEELGERSFGGGATRLVLDPIDGSLNAKRGIPFFSLSLAVAEGPVMGDVVFGFVHDFGSGEEWTASRGGGAQLNGVALDGQGPDEEIELLVCEATRTQLVADVAGELVGVARRLRLMGSLALSLCHLAAGRVDAVCSLKPARSVDIAAGLLLLRERGLVAELIDGGPLSRRRSTSRGAPASSRRPRRPRSAALRPHWAREAGLHRLLRLELRPLAARRLLPRAPARPPLAQVLRPFLRDGGGDATFYRLPRAAVANWVAETPPGFTFAIKMSRYVTHVRRLRGLSESLALFYARIAPLAGSPKLGPVLWQLPANFRRDDARLAGALEQLPAGRHCFDVPARELVRRRRV